MASIRHIKLPLFHSTIHFEWASFLSTGEREIEMRTRPEKTRRVPLKVRFSESNIFVHLCI